MPIEVAVLQLDPGAVGILGDEAHLDFADTVKIGLELPRRPEVPAEHDSGRWLIGQDPRPPTLATVLGAIVDVAPTRGSNTVSAIFWRNVRLAVAECSRRARLRR